MTLILVEFVKQNFRITFELRVKYVFSLSSFSKF